MVKNNPEKSSGPERPLIEIDMATGQESQDSARENKITNRTREKEKNNPDEIEKVKKELGQLYKDDKQSFVETLKNPYTYPKALWKGTKSVGKLGIGTGKIGMGIGGLSIVETLSKTWKVVKLESKILWKLGKNLWNYDLFTDTIKDKEDVKLSEIWRTFFPKKEKGKEKKE